MADIDGEFQVVKEEEPVAEPTTSSRYEIYTYWNKDAKLQVHLDNPKCAPIPPQVFLGVGSKKPRYDKYVNTCFNEQQDLLRFLAYVHKEAKKVGSVALLCNCKYKDFHAQSIKEFLESNFEFLDSILPYLFPTEGYKAPESTNVEGQTKEEILASLNKQEPVSPGDMMPMSGSQNVSFESLPMDLQTLIKNSIEADRAKPEEVIAGTSEEVPVPSSQSPGLKS